MGKHGELFVTVGSQMPFERLVLAVDGWFDDPAKSSCVSGFAQIGVGRARPRNLSYTETLRILDYEERVSRADLVVAHAGTGTILTALRLGVPLLVLARRAHLGETRTDHQDATATRFEQRGLLTYARDERQLAECLDAWLDGRRTSESAALAARPSLPGRADGQLVSSLRAFFDANGERARVNGDGGERARVNGDGGGR